MAKIDGNLRNNRLTGGVGDDTITGYGGSDLLKGAAGDDILIGDDQSLTPSFGFGDDTLDGGAGRDILVGGAGDDALRGGTGDDLLISGLATNIGNASGGFSYGFSGTGDGGDDTLDGGAGTDRALVALDRAAGVTIDISDPSAQSAILEGATVIGGITGIESLQFYGGVGADHATGGRLNDELVGHGGDDVLVGGAGGDYLDGGLGDDVLDGGDDFDVVTFNDAAGGVTVDLSRGSQPQDTGGAGVDTLISIEQVDGSRFDDRILGGTGNDYLSGGIGGSDVIDGRDGADAISLFRLSTGERTNSTLSGGDGGDFITIGAAAGARDRFTVDGGNDGDIVSSTVEGQQRLLLGRGDDAVWLTLGGGQATITLGIGVDTVVIHAPSAQSSVHNAAVVTDFKAGENGDRVDLTAWFGEQAIGYRSGSNPFAQGFVRLVAEDDETLVQLDRDGRDGAFGFETMLVLRGTEPQDFTGFNFGGYAPDAAIAPMIGFGYAAAHPFGDGWLA